MIVLAAVAAVGAIAASGAPGARSGGEDAERRLCRVANPRFAGICAVELAPDETCADVLRYLNKRGERWEDVLRGHAGPHWLEAGRVPGGRGLAGRASSPAPGDRSSAFDDSSSAFDDSSLAFDDSLWRCGAGQAWPIA